VSHPLTAHYPSTTFLGMRVKADVDADARIVRLGPSAETGRRVLELRFEILDEHMQRLECVSFSILPAVKVQAIDATFVRRLKVAALIDHAREALLREGAGGPAPDSEQMLQVAEAAFARTATRRTRRGPDYFVRVAQVYTKALDHGKHPTKAVEKECGVSYSRAAKLVSRARELGLLTGTSPGRPSGTTHYLSGTAHLTEHGKKAWAAARAQQETAQKPE
jgi:Family of unknown function (DUF6214)